MSSVIIYYIESIIDEYSGGQWSLIWKQAVCESV